MDRGPRWRSQRRAGQGQQGARRRKLLERQLLSYPSYPRDTPAAAAASPPAAARGRQATAGAEGRAGVVTGGSLSTGSGLCLYRVVGGWDGTYDSN